MATVTNSRRFAIWFALVSFAARNGAVAIEHDARKIDPAHDRRGVGSGLPTLPILKRQAVDSISVGDAAISTTSAVSTSAPIGQLTSPAVVFPTQGGITSAPVGLPAVSTSASTSATSAIQCPCGPGDYNHGYDGCPTCVNGNVLNGTWSGLRCHMNQPPASPDGRPTVCIGYGGYPANMQCLGNCNYLLAAAAGASPCTEATANAARGCAKCGASGAVLVTSSNGGYDDSFTTFVTELDTWCSAAPRCFSPSRNVAVSGGSCPAVNTNTAAPAVQPIRGNSGPVPIGAVIGDNGAVIPGGLSVYAATGFDGRPTLRVATVTAATDARNTVFASATNAPAANARPSAASRLTAASLWAGAALASLLYYML